MCEVMYLNGNQFLNEHSLLEILCDSAAGFERLDSSHLSVFGQSRRARESMVYCFCIRINVEDTVCFLMELFHRESNRRKRDMDGSLSYGVKSLGRQIFDSN